MDSNLVEFLVLHKKDIEAENYDKLFQDFRDFYLSTYGYFININNYQEADLLNVLIKAIPLEELLSKMTIIPFRMFEFYQGPRVDVPKNIKEIQGYSFAQYPGIVSYFKKSTRPWVDAFEEFKGTLEEKEG